MQETQTKMSLEELNNIKKEYQKSSTKINEKINSIYEVKLKEAVIGFLMKLQDKDSQESNIIGVENMFKQMEQCIGQMEAALEKISNRQNIQKSSILLTQSATKYEEHLKIIRKVIQKNNEAKEDIDIEILKSDLQGIVFRLESKNKPLKNEYEEEKKNEQVSYLILFTIQDDDVKKSIKAKELEKQEEVTKNFDGVTPNFKKYNPMHYAALMGNQQEVEKELANGADINQLDKMGRNSLYFSLLSKQTQMSKLLIQKGIKFQFVTKQNQRAIEIACSKGDLEIVQLLASKGQSVQHYSTLSPIMRAVRNQHVDVVKYLIQSGAALNQTQVSSYPLHEAVKLGNLQITKLILQKDHSVVNQNIGKGYYPIHYAIICQSLDILKELSRYGASIQVQGYRKYTPLHLAVKKNLFEITQHFINILFNKGSTLDPASRKNKTPLHLAVKNQNYSITELLVERGSSVQTFTSENNNPLHQAAKKGNVKIIEFLIKSGANLDQKNVYGQTPLDIASQRGYKDAAIYMRKVLNGIML